MADVGRATLRDLLPSVADSLKLPGGAGDELLGVSEDDSCAFALGGLKRRPKIIGLPPGSVFA